MLILSKQIGQSDLAQSECASAYQKAESMPLSYVCGYERPQDFPKRPVMGSYGYLFMGARTAPQCQNMPAKFQSLTHALRQKKCAHPSKAGSLRPALPIFAQFMDHDISASPEALTRLGASPTAHTPAPRAQMAAMLQNLRSSVLNLDSVYGGGPIQGPLARKLQASLRFPGNPAKLWAGSLEGPNQSPAALYDPRDTARDVLRLEGLLGAEEAQIRTADLRALPRPLRDVFLHRDSSVRHKRAVIGDLRNDESPALSQCHLAFVRLHNRFVDHAEETPGAPSAAHPGARFGWAQKMAKWHYQWLVLNAFLPAICDPHIFASVRMRGPSIYARFIMNWRAPSPTLLPLPLEFSAAAFGVAKLRASQIEQWDYTDLQSLFIRSGNASSPLDLLPQSMNVPAHMACAPEWAQFVHRPLYDIGSVEEQHTKNQPINAPASAGLDNAAVEEAQEHLLRGYRMNLPTGQACLEALELIDEITLPRLSPEDLRSGATGALVRDAGFDQNTPLWFYLYKEAEVLGQSGRLGPLGSLLVADTILGLVVHDLSSFWNAAPGRACWHPKEGVRPDGIVLDDLPSMLEAAGLL